MSTTRNQKFRIIPRLNLGPCEAIYRLEQVGYALETDGVRVFYKTALKADPLVATMYLYLLRQMREDVIRMLQLRRSAGAIEEEIAY